MEIIITLLAIIAGSELIRFYLTHKQPSRKAHFKAKLKGTKRMVWDLEFKIFKLLEMKEDLIKEFDFMNSKIDTLNKKIEAEKDKEVKANLKDQLELAQIDANNLEGQMQGIDLQVYGTKKSEQYPEGVMGTTEELENLEAFIGLIEDYVKKG